VKQDTPTPTHLEDLASIPASERSLFTVYATVRSARSGHTSQNKRYVDLEVADQTATVGAKIWDDASAVQDAALAIPAGHAVKLLFQPSLYQGAVQLNLKGVREVSADDEGIYRPAAVYGEGIELVEDLLCKTLVFDIETVPSRDKRELPNTVAESLGKFSEYKEMETSAVMGMSPFFGKVVSLAIGEGNGELSDQKVTVLVVPPDDDPEASAFPDWMRPMSEADLLRAFWVLAGAATDVVTYNGRGFDVPFLINRSLAHGIPARVDLLSNRYALHPHLDLLQVLKHGAYGNGPTTLDVVCWAFDIESPKGKMDGSMVAPAYARGEIEEIAHYNAADVRATTAVYQRVRDGLLQYRKDW